MRYRLVAIVLVVSRWVRARAAAGDREVPVASVGDSVEYISIVELAQRTPWSVAAIRRMVQRGVLQRGVHVFQLAGPRGRLLVDWHAVERLIREGSSGSPGQAAEEIDVAAIREEARALLVGATR